MAVAKTTSFFLTERLTLTTAGTVYQGTLDLGAYVDAGDAQGLAIESVDFIAQGHNTTTNVWVPLGGALAGNGNGAFQLMSNNPNTALIAANDHRLIASGELYFGNTGQTVQQANDIFPDNFGKGDQSYYVVNDQLYLVGSMGGTRVANSVVELTVRIRARIVKLQQKDWMAIAIQQTGQDN